LVNVGQSEKDKSYVSSLNEPTKNLVQNYLENVNRIGPYESDILIHVAMNLRNTENGERIKRYVRMLRNSLNVHLNNQSGKCVIVRSTIDKDIDIYHAKSEDQREKILIEMIKNTKVVLLCKFLLLNIYDLIGL
jgi:predicted solute-binding protein